MFNSCKTADVSHFKSICYIIRFICGNKMLGTKEKKKVNKVVMELLSKHLSLSEQTTEQSIIHWARLIGNNPKKTWESHE